MQAAVNKAKVELVEPDLLRAKARRRAAADKGLLEQGEIEGVERVLLALEPVAGQLGEDDLDEPVLPAKGFPVGDKGRRLRAHVSPEQPGFLLHRVAGDLHLFAKRLRLERLVEALARPVVEPAVERAA